MISDTEANYLYQEHSYYISLQSTPSSTNRLSKKLFLGSLLVTELKRGTNFGRTSSKNI